MKRKHIYIGAGILISGTIAYLIINNQMNKAKIGRINDVLDGNNPPSKTGGGKTTSPDLPDAKFPLKVGSYGKQVQDVQKALNAKYGTNLVTDGKFGEGTVEALCKHYYTLCFSNTQGRLYTLGQSDYDKLINK